MSVIEQVWSTLVTGAAAIVVGLFCASWLLMLGALYRGLRFEMHMFQQNSYRTERMWRWHKRHLKKYVVNLLLVLLFVLTYFYLFTTRIMSIISFCSFPVLTVWLYAQRGSRGAIKPLVWTARVRRLGAAMLILAALAGLITWYVLYHLCELRFDDWWFWAAISVYVSAALAPLIIYLAAAAVAPVERAIANRYIADARRMLSEMPELEVVGVTGSFGKSSVKHYVAALMCETADTLATPESYNTTMGVVRTIRESLRPTHRLFVCEMGARQSGDIAEICELVRPKYGIITALGEQHLETFKSVENIVNTKYELARALPNDGVLFLNYDNDLIRANAPFDGACHPRIVTYGTTDGCEYRASDIRVSRDGTAFNFTTPRGVLSFEMSLIGAHNVQNVAGALAVAFELGADAEMLTRRLRRLEGVPHRLQILDKGTFIVIDDAYNSNPAGAKAALDTLALFDGTKILITPGMVELGVREAELNRELGVQAAAVCDYIILVGEARTRPIRDGVLSAGFPASRLHTASRFFDAYALAQTLGTSSVILIENDLPDSLQ